MENNNFDMNFEIIKMLGDLRSNLLKAYSKASFFKKFEVKKCIKNVEKIQGNVLVTERDRLSCSERMYLDICDGIVFEYLGVLEIN